MNIEKAVLIILVFIGSIWGASSLSYKRGYRDSTLEWQSNTVKMGYAHYNMFSGMWEWKPNLKELTLTNITTVVEEPHE
jgi:hypothetical protein